MTGKANGAEPKPDHQLSLPEARRRLKERAGEIAELEARIAEQDTSLQNLTAERDAASRSAADAVAAGEAAERARAEAELKVEALTQERDAANQEVARLRSVAAENMRLAEARAEAAAAARPRGDQIHADSVVFALKEGFTDYRQEGAVEERYLPDEAAVETLRLEMEATGRVWKCSPTEL